MRRSVFAFIALFLLLPVLPLWAQTFNDFWRFVTSSAEITLPLRATDFLAVVRGRQTFRLPGSNFAGRPSAASLPTPYHFFANPGGSNNNDCLTATVTGGHGPCETIAHTVDVAMSYDAAGGDYNINLSAGTFTSGVLVSGYITGGASNNFNGFVNFIGAGDSASGTPTNLHITDPLLWNKNGAIIATEHTNVTLSGMDISCTQSATCSDLFVQNLAYLNIGPNVSFGAAGASAEQIHVEALGEIELQSNIRISAGGGTSFMSTLSLGYIEFDPASLVVTCSAPGNWNYPNGFFRATQNSLIYLSPSISFSGCGGITGPQAVVFDGALITADGNNAIAGTIPGSTSISPSNAGLYSPAPSGTGTKFTVTNQRWLTGAQRSPLMDQATDSTNYSVLSFNGDITRTTMSGLLGGATGDDNLYSLVPTGAAFLWRVNNVTQATLDATSGLDLLSHPFKGASSIALASIGFVSTAPTIASGGCTTGSAQSISASNGTAAFEITLGGATCGSTITVDLPGVAHGWVCDAHNITNPASNVVEQSAGGSTTTVTFTNYVRTTGVAGNFTGADKLVMQCTGY